jgi:MOSC domain-containing protein YiiM
MGDDAFPGAFEKAGRPGVYLRIVSAGSITAGALIDVDPADPPAVPIAALVEDEIDADVLRLAVDDHRVPQGWRTAAARALGRA